MRYLTALMLCATLAGQTAAPPGLVAGVRNFTHIVTSLERSVEFYRDVIGLQVEGAPRVFGGDLAMKVVNLITPGAQSLFTSLKVPGSPLGVEIVEYTGVDRRPVRPRFQDPGAASLVLTVRDMDAIIARARKAGAHVGTVGSMPLTMEGSGRVIVLQDPDGLFVELYQPFTVPGTSASGNVIGSSFEMVIADTDRTLRLYREALGFDPRVGTFDGTKLYMDIAGTPGAQFKRSTAIVPGTAFTIAFLEFKDIDRMPLQTRFQDPGTPVLQLLVRDVHAVTSAWKKAGGEVVTAGGEPVTLGALTLVVLRDLNGLMLEMISAP